MIRFTFKCVRQSGHSRVIPFVTYTFQKQRNIASLICQIYYTLSVICIRLYNLISWLPKRRDTARGKLERGGNLALGSRAYVLLPETNERPALCLRTLIDVAIDIGFIAVSPSTRAW